jgi:hypothetical protein
VCNSLVKEKCVAGCVENVVSRLCRWFHSQGPSQLLIITGSFNMPKIRNLSKLKPKTVVVVKKQKKSKVQKKKNHQAGGNIKGKGDYSFLGNIGSKVGGFLGDAAQNVFKSITGFGDYRIRAQNMNMGVSPPSFGGGSAPIICHREFITTVSTPGSSFTLSSYPINPGLNATYPWLAQAAQCFEEYKLLGCVFEFKTTSASALNSTNTALGTVIMSTEYDVMKPNFQSRKEMENYEFTTSCAPCESMLHPIECDRTVNPLGELFVRSMTNPIGSDKRMYDLGNFQIATEGQQAASVIGELWVTYKVQLLKPRLPQIGQDPSQWVHYQSTNANGLPYTSNLLPYGVGTSTATITSSTINFFKPSRYLIIYSALNGSGAITNITFSPGTNAAAVGFVSAAAIPGVSIASASATGSCGFYCVDITGSSGTVNMSSGGGISGTTNSDFVIIELPKLSYVSPREFSFGEVLEQLQTLQKRVQLLPEHHDINSESPFENVVSTTNLTESTILSRALAKLSTTSSRRDSSIS